MTIEEPQHVAMPKLYGAPAYARPPHQADDVARPFDPDELPIEAERTDEEHEFVSALPPAPGRPAASSSRRASRPRRKPASRRASACGALPAASSAGADAEPDLTSAPV